MPYAEAVDKHKDNYVAIHYRNNFKKKDRRVHSRGHDELWLTLLHNQGHGPFQARHLGLRHHCLVLCNTPVCRSLLTIQYIKKQIRAKDTLYIFRFVLYQSTWNKISKYLKKKKKEHSPSLYYKCSTAENRSEMEKKRKKEKKNSQKPSLSVLRAQHWGEILVWSKYTFPSK